MAESMGLVLELQKDATNSNIRVTDLLRKALLVAKKLRVGEFAEWAEAELQGYMDREEIEIPAYRFLRGRPMMQDRWGRWLPIIFQNDPEFAELFSRRSNGQPIAQLEASIESSGESRQIQMPYNIEAQAHLMENLDFEGPSGLFLQTSDLQGIIDAVRTTVLNWTISLEEEEIVGDGMTFSNSDREKASGIPQNVSNFYGPTIVQQGSDSQQFVSIDINPDRARETIQKILAELPDAGLGEDDEAAARINLESAEQLLDSPSPPTGAIRSLLASTGLLAKKAAGAAGPTVISELVKRALTG